MNGQTQSTDDLKKQILSTNLELESVKSLATESQQNVNNLLVLLNAAYRERDEARNELQKIFNKMNPSTPIDQFPHVVQPECSIFIPPKANSPISESNSHFETCINNQSHNTSLVDSLFDALFSPDISNVNMADSSHMGFSKQPLTEELNGTTSIPTGVEVSFGLDARIDYVAKGKSLPQKGKLLQAMMEAGPLLQTLFVTGPPLPRWRNPPTLQPLKGCASTAASFVHKPVEVASPTSYLNLPSYPEMSRGFSQTCSAAILNFNNLPSAVSCKTLRMLNSSSCFDHQIPTAK